MLSLTPPESAKVKLSSALIRQCGRVACRDRANSKAEEQAGALSDVHRLSVYSPREHWVISAISIPRAVTKFRRVMFQAEIPSTGLRLADSRSG
jgi:hypothetical protein